MEVMILVPSLEEKGPIIVAESISKFSLNQEIKYIYVSLKKNTESDLKRFEKLDVIELDMKKNLIGLLTSFKKIKKIIKERKIQIIHTHCFLPTIIASQIKEAKKITTLHNDPWKDYVYKYGKVLGNIMAYIELFCNRKNKKNIAISKYIEQVFKKKGLKNIEIIYNGVRAKNILAETTKKEGINLVTVSVLNNLKNVYYGIDIVESLIKKEVKVFFKIIGDGPEKNNLVNYVKEKKLEKNIIFLGKVPRENIFTEIQMEDIFLLTSKSEGFGLVVAEAMAVGVPAIVSRIPVMEELIENNKNGVLANNLDEFQTGIIFIKKNLSYFSENAIKKYQNEFRVEKMVELYENKYIKILGDM